MERGKTLFIFPWITFENNAELDAAKRAYEAAYRECENRENRKIARNLGATASTTLLANRRLRGQPGHPTDEMHPSERTMTVRGSTAVDLFDLGAKIIVTPYQEDLTSGKQVPNHVSLLANMVGTVPSIQAA